MSQSRNIAASIRQRLLDISKAQGVDFDSILVRFAVERILARLSQSPFADRFILKGAMLFTIWNENTHRPTRDLDFLGFGKNDAEEVASIFRQILDIPVTDDGLVFDADSIAVAPIKALEGYGGLAVKFIARLGSARISVQIDIGYGDVVSPGPETVDFPNLLPDFAAPRIRAYPVYTAIAEKFEAAVRLGEANGRMKDFYDLWFMLTRLKPETAVLRSAIRRTFEHRGTPLPVGHAVIFTREFAELKEKAWKQFLARNSLTEPTASFLDLLKILAEKLPV